MEGEQITPKMSWSPKAACTRIQNLRNKQYRPTVEDCPDVDQIKNSHIDDVTMGLREEDILGSLKMRKMRKWDMNLRLEEEEEGGNKR